MAEKRTGRPRPATPMSNEGRPLLRPILAVVGLVVLVVVLFLVLTLLQQHT